MIKFLACHVWVNCKKTPKQIFKYSVSDMQMEDQTFSQTTLFAKCDTEDQK